MFILKIFDAEYNFIILKQLALRLVEFIFILDFKPIHHYLKTKSNFLGFSFVLYFPFL